MSEPDELDDYLRRSPGPGRRAVDMDIGRALTLSLSVISLVTSVFLAGYYWRQLTDVAAAQALFQRKDVAEQQYKNVLDRIDDVKQQNDRLQVSVDQLIRGKKE